MRLPDFFIEAKGGKENPHAEMAVLFGFEAKTFKKAVHNLHEKFVSPFAEKGHGNCNLLTGKAHCDDPRLQAIQQGFGVFSSFDIVCAGFCIAPPVDMWTSEAAEEADPESQDDMFAQTAKQTFRVYKQMVVGWIVLDRRPLKVGADQIGYHFLRPEQAENVRTGREATTAYKTASVNLGCPEAVNQHLVSHFIQLIVLMQHQWMLPWRVVFAEQLVKDAKAGKRGADEAEAGDE